MTKTAIDNPDQVLRCAECGKKQGEVVIIRNINGKDKCIECLTKLLADNRKPER